MDRGVHVTRAPTARWSGSFALLFLTAVTLLSSPTHANDAARPPDDSEYIIFIVDTSGSMFNHVWPMSLDEPERSPTR